MVTLREFNCYVLFGEVILHMKDRIAQVCMKRIKTKELSSEKHLRSVLIFDRTSNRCLEKHGACLSTPGLDSLVSISGS